MAYMLSFCWHILFAALELLLVMQLLASDSASSVMFSHAAISAGWNGNIEMLWCILLD